jgi:acetolactate synthase-1/2/3 large subunit
LQRFAENWRLPVANAFRFQDTFDNHHPLYAGDVGIGINPALAKRVKEADLIIAIGPRLGEMTTNGYTLLASPRPAQKLVHIHASAEELNRVYRADLGVCASMNAAARALEVLDAPASVAWNAHSSLDSGEKSTENTVFETWQQPEALAGLNAASPRGPVDMAQVIAVVQKHLPADAVITNGAGNFASWVHRYFRFHGLAKGFKTQLAPTNGAMGYGVPAGIAASISTGRMAFTIAGDGDFLMNGQELATATMHGAKPIIVLLNNASFGTIRMHQEREFPTRTQGAGNALVNPDFCALAQAYGFATHRVERTDQFEAAFVAALQAATSATGQGSLIEIMIDVNVISTRATLEHMTKQALSR